jgi:hypothetical protein
LKTFIIRKLPRGAAGEVVIIAPRLGLKRRSLINPAGRRGPPVSNNAVIPLPVTVIQELTVAEFKDYVIADHPLPTGVARKSALPKPKCPA